MNLNTTAISSLFAIGALISMGATAASDAEKATEGQPAASETKKFKPHSVEEKGGAVSSGSEQQAEKSESVKNKKKHLHPRDGK